MDGTHVINVHNDMINRNIYYKCEIVIEEAAKYSFLSDYYDRVMDVVLVSRDGYGNKIFHNKIMFDNTFDGYKKYKCEIRYKNKYFKYDHPVEKLFFITILLNA